MLYKAYFTDIHNIPYLVEITTPESGSTEYELTLAGDPVIVSVEGGELYSPIKPTSCTINIMSDGGLFDLYTINPQSVTVVVRRRDNDEILFKGYATPMQYGQDWTTIDTLTLECVDLVSSLKNIKYAPYGSYKQYIDGETLIEWVLSHVAEEPTWLRWEWPYVNILGLNSYSFNTTIETLQSMSFNEANFFDDDDQQTPWTFYEVLEEICKYFNVTCTMYQGRAMFIDYVYAAWQTYGTYNAYRVDLDGNYTLVSYSKNASWNDGYAGGTTSIETDDLYNVINVNTNRYDINELCDDLFKHKPNHISITKEKGFGDGNQVYTWTKEHFFGADENTYKYAFKTFCRMNTSKTRWRHHCYQFIPYTSGGTVQYLKEVGTYYNESTYTWLTTNGGNYYWVNIPENKYINTMGAEIVHYAVLDSITTRPTKLDWQDVVMFQCAHPSMQTPNSEAPSGLPNGRFMFYDMYDGTLEKEALTYESDYEMCFSPKDGTSWIAINAKLFYQQNINGPAFSNVPQPIDFKQLTTSFIPFDELTDYPPYDMSFTGSSGGSGDGTLTVTARRDSSSQAFGTGFKLLKLRLKIGDKYWNGTQWTTNDSTFFMNFAKRYTDKNNVEYEAARYYDWMDAISTTDYESKVGAEGYCIPIQKEDCVCGKLKLDIFMPRMLEVDLFMPQWRNLQIQWWELCPVVFMKDFSVDYVYTDESEWYLNEELETDDVMYTNADLTKDQYTYEKNIEFKINSWQTQRPISKSFPIVRFTENNTEHCEYLVTTNDQFGAGVANQELHTIYRNLRHYYQPTLIYNANRHNLLAPWMRIQMSDASEIDDSKKFLVDSQEFNVRDCNNRVKMIDFGIYNNS